MGPRHRLLHAAAYSVIGMAFVVLAVIAWLTLYPLSPGTQVRSVEVVSTEVRPGGQLEAMVDYCKSTPGTATTAFTIVTNEQVFYLPRVTSNRPLGCDRVLITLNVPSSIAPGEAHLEVDVERRYSPLHLDVVSTRSNEFTILGP